MKSKKELQEIYETHKDFFDNLKNLPNESKTVNRNERLQEICDHRWDPEKWFNKNKLYKKCLICKKVVQIE